jgi:CarD family transcriptional regulator
MFSINEIVFYPGQGVATIAGILEREVGGVTTVFYNLKFLHKDMTIMVPCGGVATSGIRLLADARKINSAFGELGNVSERKKSAFDFAPSGWSKRQREYQLKIQGGDLGHMVATYRDLSVLSFEKELSFGEKHILALVTDLISQEVAYSLSCSRADVVMRLKQTLHETHTHLIEGPINGGCPVQQSLH